LSRVTTLAVGGGGTLLVCGCEDGTVRMIHTPTANCIAQIKLSRLQGPALRVSLSSCLPGCGREDIVVAHGLGGGTLCELVEKPLPLAPLLGDVSFL